MSVRKEQIDQNKYTGIVPSSPLLQNKNKPMKTILTFIGIFFIIIITTPNGSATGIKKHRKAVKAKATVIVDTKTTKAGDASDYVVSINGKQNTVKIGDAEVLIQTPANPVEATGKNTIEINGEGNSVTVNPETAGKVAVKQTGNKNRVNISQSTSIHSNPERR